MNVQLNNSSMVDDIQILIVVPTYNETNNVLKLLSEIFTYLPNAHVLFVDDNSKDGTIEKIKNHPDFNQKIFLLQRSHKLGLGSAYIAGFKWALAKDAYQFICQMDADLSHDPKYLHQMLSKIEHCDLMIGSRYVQNGGIENWAFIRKLISRFGSWYARSILSIPMKDLTGGFNLWRTSGLKSIPLDKVRSEGYSFQIELKYRATRNNFRIAEFPIVFKDRVAGKSKMSLKICIEAFYRVLQMKFINE